MKKYLLLLLIIFQNAAYAQKLYLKSFSYLDKEKFDTSEKNLLGGFSAIEYNPIQKKWSLLSDKTDTDTISYIFDADIESGTINKTSLHGRPFFKQRGVESFRYSNETAFFAAEKDDVSFIGLISTNKESKILYSTPLSGKLLTTNRGIEGLTFMPGKKELWYALESGASVDCDKENFTNFYKVTYAKPLPGKNDFVKSEKYTYAIDRCQCLEIGQKFGPDNGSGVSEILAYDQDRLLVMERCYNEKNRKCGSQVKIFLAKIDKSKKMIVKTDTLFDFNNKEDYNASSQGHLEPDNLEGMAWGPGEGLKRLLYVISDDNFKDCQKTQLFVLSQEKVKEDVVATGVKTAAGESKTTTVELAGTDTKIVCDDLIETVKPAQGNDDKKNSVAVVEKPAKNKNCICKLLECICRKPKKHYKTPVIEFDENGEIVSKMPAFIEEGEMLSISIDDTIPVAEATRIGKAFEKTNKILSDPKQTLDPITRMLGFESKNHVECIVKQQFDNYYKPFVTNSVIYSATLNGKPFPINQKNYKDSVKIENAEKYQDKQTLLVTKQDADNKFVKAVFAKAEPSYEGWGDYKNTFEKLYADYAALAVKIDKLLMERELLDNKGRLCSCNMFDSEITAIKRSLCAELDHILLTQVELCVIANEVVKNNKCWMSSWLWLTDGKARLNPFGITSASEFNNQLNKRLAKYEELLKLYQDLSRQDRMEDLTSLTTFFAEPISNLSGEIADLKALQSKSEERDAKYQQWLKKTAATENILSKTLLYSTGSETINWMNNYNSQDDYIKMNPKNSFPERVFEDDNVHGLVHNLTAKQKVSAKENVKETKLRTELDLGLEDAANALDLALTSLKRESFKSIVPVSMSIGPELTESSDTVKLLKPCTDLESKIEDFRAKRVLIDWLNDQTEPPIEDLKAAYGSFDVTATEAAFHSQETLVGESRSAEGTNIITYDIFEEGKEKAVANDKYQTYETIRWWPFVSINYVYGSRSTAIFDKTTGAFKAYTDIDNFEVFAGAKWYLASSNVTRTHKRTKFISETVGREFNAARGNGLLSKTFIFLGLGIRHDFLRNYGAGIGFDLVPGFSIHGGTNLYFRKKYELVNGIVKKEFDIPNANWFVGISVDANIVTRFISIF